MIDENHLNHLARRSAGRTIGGIIVFIIIILLIIIIIIGGIYLYRTYNARRLGLPPPSINPFASQANVSTRNYPARGGVVGWIEGKMRGFRSGRRNRGGYESDRGGRGGFGPLDPDEAWDTRVGNEADYEEQELGLRHGRADSDLEPHPDGGYGPAGGRGYGPQGGLGGLHGMDGHGRGRSLTREDLDERYEEEMHPHSRTRDPFTDSAEPSDISTRGRSPRPGVNTQIDQNSLSQHSKDDSPTERRSIFKEAV